MHLIGYMYVEGSLMGDGHAQTSDGTCCSTFKDQHR